MAVKPDANTFYECLKAEIRSLLRMPEDIKTKPLFEGWLNGANVASVGTVTRLEALLCGEAKIIIESQLDGTTTVESQLKKAKYTLRFRLDSQGNYHSQHNADEGINSIEYWLNNIKAQLNESVNTTNVIFIVGTHGDQAAGTKEERTKKVERIVEDAELAVDDVHIMEVSCHLPADGSLEYPGVSELHHALMDAVGKLSHIGEEVPKSYAEIEQVIRALAKEREASGAGLTMLIRYCMY